jgi:hypothetical protein
VRHATAGSNAVNRGFMTAFIRKDPTAVAALYTLDGQLLPPRSAAPAVRREAEEEWGKEKWR